MDKMYIKLDNKMCLINHRHIKKEEEVRTGKILDRITIGEEIGHSVENEVIIVIEVMDEVEVILEKVVFEVGPVVTLEGNNSRDRSREDRRPWGQSRSRERGMRARSESSSQSRSNLRTSTNRDKVQCFKCREYDHFANECPNLVPKDSDRESDAARSASLHILADSDTGLEVEQYLNI